ncbi:MAG TPA: transposase [Hyphomicrobiaceae bacterium]|nr:transposase [Hyphomicrobiaceae bacterium]
MHVDALLYRASKLDCDVCPFKPRCCPKEPARKVPRSSHAHARDVARALGKTETFQQSCRDRKRGAVLFADLKRIRTLGRLRLREPRGAQLKFTLAALAQQLSRVAKLAARSLTTPSRGVRSANVRCIGANASMPQLPSGRTATRASRRSSQLTRLLCCRLLQQDLPIAQVRLRNLL